MIKGVSQIARSLLAATPREAASDVRDALCALSAALHGDSALRAHLSSPALTPEQRQSALSIDGIPASVQHAVALLAESRQLSALPALARSFADLCTSEYHLSTVTVALSPDFSAEETATLTQGITAHHLPAPTITQSAHSGVTITVGDTLVDATFDTKLKHLKKALTGTTKK